MRTSYNQYPLEYGNLFELLTWLIKPTKIVEFGILDGYSLRHFSSCCEKECQIEGYDIFEDFVGNHADYESTVEKFTDYPNISIHKGDFFKKYQDFLDESIDILHIDIANDGTTYDFALQKYWSKIKEGGVLIMEGGSEDRDNVSWMKQYHKKPIRDFLKDCPNDYQVIDIFPSITIFRK